MSWAKVTAVLGRVHWSIWSAIGALSLYSALGFLAVPAGIRYALTHTLSQQWQRPVSVGEITFNPFDFDLRIANFAIGNAAMQADLPAVVSAEAANAEAAAANPAAHSEPGIADEAPESSIASDAPVAIDNTADAVAVAEIALPEAGDLVRFESLHINVHLSSLFKRQIGFELIELVRPYIRAEISEQGELELLQVFSGAKAEPKVPAAAQAASSAQGAGSETVATEQIAVDSRANANNVNTSDVSASENAANNTDRATASTDAAASGENLTIDNAVNETAQSSESTAVTAKAASNESAQTDAIEPAAALPPIWLASLRIVQGEIDFLDHSRGDFAQKLLLKGIEIEDFHTARDDRSNRVSLQLNDSMSGDISFNTEHFRLQPFALQGQLQIQQLALAPVWQWLNLPLNFALQAPVLDLTTDIALAQADGFSVKTDKGQLRLAGTKLAPKTQPEQGLIALQELSVDGIAFDLQQQSLVLAQVQATGTKLELALDKKGNLNILPLFVSIAKKDEKTTEASADKEAAIPWSIKIGRTVLRDSEVAFTDNSPSKPFKALIAPITIELGEFEPLNPAKSFMAKAELGVGSPRQEASRGSLSADSQVQLQPLAIQAAVNIDALPLSLAQAYVGDVVRGRLARGELTAQLQLDIDDAVRVRGDAGIQQLQLLHQSGRASLLSLDKLQVADLDYQTSRNSLAIKQIAVNKLVSSFRINEDGSTNVSDLLIAQPESNKPAGKPLQLAINTVAINNADLGFADHTLSQNFQVAIKDLSGAIKNIHSNANQMATVNLTGKVDHYAPASIKGQFNVFGKQPNLDMAVKFDNVELTSFTPYSGTYAGFKIERGQLDIDLNYQLLDNKIAGKNRIVMDQFTLGEKIESPKAVDLPLRLALALLRDEKGVIDLGFEVKGDLNDPSFSVGGILWKVLTNIVMKAVASPMKALGALSSFGGATESNAIEFTAGSAQLSELAQQQASELKTALDKRSEFRLNLQGNVEPNTDRLALQRAKLANALAPGDSERQAQWLEITDPPSRSMRRQLAKMYETSLQKSYDDALATVAEQFAAADEDEVALRTFKAVFDELAVAQKVDDGALRQLAMDRALALRAYMTETLGFAANRVMVVDYKNDAETAGNNCLILLAM